MKITQYYINENLAKSAKEMNSFSDYIENSETQEYLTMLNDFENEINLLITNELSEEKKNLIEYYANKYSEKLANAFNKLNSIRSRCPSVMIVGAGNFPVARKLKQTQALDNFYKENGDLFNVDNFYYKKIKNIINKKDKTTNDIFTNRENETFYNNSNLGINIIKNFELNRIQIFFDEIPNSKIRTSLKKCAFKWSPNNKAWQRQLTQNAIYATKRLIDNLFKEI